MALVGINTAIDAMKQKFTESFASMGSNGFTIHYKDYQFFGRNNQVTKEKKGAKKEKVSIPRYPSPRIRQKLFKKNYHFHAKVSISLRGGNSNIVSLGNYQNKSDGAGQWGAMRTTLNSMDII